MRGKSSEIDFINGEVVQIAKHLHLPCPLNEKVVDMVHEVERSGKYFTFDQVKNAFNVGAGSKPALR
jgi:2-dehydropantoate 2-reductase